MSVDMSISLSRLQELVDEVQRTKRPRTVDLGANVVAVLKPATRAKRRVKRLLPGLAEPANTFTLEEAFGSVPTPPELHGKDVDDMIREAKEERAERLVKRL